MKKLFSLTILLVTTAILFAQETATATATVSVVLKSAVSISLDNPNVVLTYETNEDYKNGVKELKKNHINAFSTSPYRITSSVAKDNLITKNDISLNGLLQTRNKKTELYQGTPGQKFYNVEYSAKGDYAYVEKDKKTYITQVIYTIEAL